MSARKRRATTETYLTSVVEVLNQFRAHWPLTLRQVYYQLVSAGLIKNNRNEYQKLSRILTDARQEGIVSWAAIEDRSRTVIDYLDWPDMASFVEHEVGGFLSGYRRDLLQGQRTRPEIWTEKDALSHVIDKVAVEYTVPVVVARGFSSTTFKQHCVNRINRTCLNGQATTILYFGDLDPSGWEMPLVMGRYFDNAVSPGLVEIRRIALNEEQINKYSLPTDPTALKDSDTRAAKYRQQFGDLAVELDALNPDSLQALVTSAIEAVLDMDELERQRELETEESDTLDTVRDGVIEQIRAAVGVA